MYSIGELARRTGVKIPTIRYYEQMGLMEPPERSSGNQRRYTQHGLERLSFIRHARQLGLSIEDIRELVDLSQRPERPCHEAHQIAARHLENLQARIAKLKKLEKELKRITGGSDTGQVGACHVIRALADHSLCDGDHG
ncbi:MAG: MerR family transcriptional regulator [Rhizobiaceae bacterium]|nr:MerR family transcriptional regulator [Rhizobiaceae bacterium]